MSASILNKRIYRVYATRKFLQKSIYTYNRFQNGTKDKKYEKNILNQTKRSTKNDTARQISTSRFSKNDRFQRPKQKIEERKKKYRERHFSSEEMTCIDNFPNDLKHPENYSGKQIKHNQEEMNVQNVKKMICNSKFSSEMKHKENLSYKTSKKA